MYQKFLNLAHAIDEMMDFPPMTPDEKCLIKHLNVFWVMRKDITVLQTVRQVNHLSQATVLRHLKNLKNKGYIKMVIDESDNRIKYIRPTKLITQYFAEHGKLLLASAKTSYPQT